MSIFLNDDDDDACSFHFRVVSQRKVIARGSAYQTIYVQFGAVNLSNKIR